MTHCRARPRSADPSPPVESLWRLLWNDSIFRAIAGLPGIASTRFF